MNVTHSTTQRDTPESSWPQDTRLSYRARGLLAAGLAAQKPETLGYFIRLTRDGKMAVSSAMKELCKASYVRRVTFRIGGKIVSSRYHFTAAPRPMEGVEE